MGGRAGTGTAGRPRGLAAPLPTGTHDIHALILGRAITGIQAFAPSKPPAPRG